MMRFIASVCGFVGVVLVAGCGDGGPSPVAVKGVLKLDGKPVAGAVVGFHPEAAGGKPAFGTTDAEGAFRLTTERPGDGALPGKYKIVIQPPAEGGGSPYDDPGKAAPAAKAPAGPAIPAKYTR